MASKCAVWMSLGVAVCWAGFCTAGPTILWEDFSDEDGNPAFDPSFVHTIGADLTDSQGYE